MELALPAPGLAALLESEAVCALAAKANITVKKGTIARLRKCLGEAATHISRPWLRETNTLSII